MRDVNESAKRRLQKKFGKNFEWRTHAGYPKSIINRETYDAMRKEGSTRKEILDCYALEV